MERLEGAGPFYLLIVEDDSHKGRQCELYEFKSLRALIRKANTLRDRRAWAFCVRDRIPLERADLFGLLGGMKRGVETDSGEDSEI